MMTEREAMAILVSAIGIGYAHRERALTLAGSATALLEDPFAYGEALGFRGVSAIRQALAQSVRMLEHLDKEGVQLILRTDANYPRLLKHTARPPHLLFCAGNAQLDDPFPLAVVGTRSASQYGLRHTRAICSDLAASGICIVSGLALGVDGAAHQGALDGGGRTVAVLGGALDRFYPRENRRLMEQIVQSGGSVITEYALGISPNRYSFLERNRIIAGMALGTLVTEGPARSGASHTATCALEEGREVFALPGDVDRETSVLPNRLIAEGAHVATCAADILKQLVIEPTALAQPSLSPVRQDLAEAEPLARPLPLKAPEAVRMPQEGPQLAIYRALETQEMDFDALSEMTQIASDELGALLMMMELEGLIESLPGCRYGLA